LPRRRSTCESGMAFRAGSIDKTSMMGPDIQHNSQTTSSAWQDKPVLVSGAGGFIASHLVEELVRQGARVRAFVRYNSRGDPGLLALLPAEVYSRLEVIGGDLRDLPAVQAAMRGVACVFHLGALIAIPYSYVHPAEVVETNVMGTLNMLLAAREAGVERLVHTSTSEVYGTALRVPIDETHPLQGQSPYSASKIGADKLAESFYRSFDLPVVTVRPFNTYGPRQSARAVIPTIISQALTQEQIRLGNLEARRDLTYVSDTVDGFLKVAERRGIEGGTFNLGAGTEIRIADLAQEIISLLDKRVEIVVEAERLRPEKSEVQRLLSDNSQARERLGWAPRVDLRTGLGYTIDWIRQHLDRYRPNLYQV
jgi:NAD dependent epimerase/dehydratase